ncbi:Pilus biogenesis CpaD protein (pilus_cpaD) [Enhydrobacter aerosaccus]|uniref:Pilus biogenesis CpaD protein (Pilus_cpaD) n=1 Tax=Enhydrobacter aerosaccus TaxID=225324 RepID=A0A1T4T9J0_9HYPH|nr:CpaD family pilus assembly lipoprotein [Enhydrobacter aerosaccus]SKA36939.1 Pilus biogenesis CpaD protein (pilus_cpaD) [Enhydrobacter aerosaccus]
MRSVFFALLAAGTLCACDNPNPVAEEAKVGMRMTPVRADTILAIGFRPGTGQIDPNQAHELHAMVNAGRAAQRDEFVVVTDGSGGPIQQARAQQVMRSLSGAGARWVSSAVEPAMAMGPNQVVVVRSDYRLGERNCPDDNPATIRNNTESVMGGFGCTTAYNMGQMLARPRDAAVGRDPGPADGTVNAAAIQRYREGKVRTVTPTATTTDGVVGATTGATGATGGAGPGVGSGPSTY